MKYRLYITERSEGGEEYDFENPIHIPSVGEKISYQYRQEPDPRHSGQTKHYIVKERHTLYQEVSNPQGAKPEDLCMVTLVVEKVDQEQGRELEKVWNNPFPS